MGYEIPSSFVDEVKADGSPDYEWIQDPREAVANADVVYSDVWASMGQESEKEERLTVFKNYRIDDGLMGLAKPDALFMHCLPAHRGEEVTDSVIDGKNSIVFDEAENRLHIQRAIIALLIPTDKEL
jgi:ornithine carbamoyltransferase